MEWVQTELIQVKNLESKKSSSCHLFGCQFHHLAFVIDESGKVQTTEQVHSYVEPNFFVLK